MPKDIDPYENCDSVLTYASVDTGKIYRLSKFENIPNTTPKHHYLSRAINLSTAINSRAARCFEHHLQTFASSKRKLITSQLPYTMKAINLIPIYIDIHYKRPMAAWQRKGELLWNECQPISHLWGLIRGVRFAVGDLFSPGNSMESV